MPGLWKEWKAKSKLPTLSTSPHVHILEMNGESYRLKNSKRKKEASAS
jgi:hypothetical protein